MPPLLYLIRHAHALDAPDDSIRKLSPRGREDVKRLAAIVGRGGAFAPAEVWHSPLVRAKETAELLIHTLELKPRWHEQAELVPEADPGVVALAIERVRAPLALVGHEPFMSALASLLVTGATEPTAFVFMKATALALEPAGARWQVRWQISPDLFGNSRASRGVVGELESL